MKKAIAIVFLLLALSLTASANTGGEKRLFGDNEYQFFETDCTWKEAELLCREMGGHLVTVSSPEEQAFLDGETAEDASLWIGAYKDGDLNWHWVTGEAWNYTNFAESGQLSPENGSFGAVCGGKWLTFGGDDTLHGYICEWEGTKPECTVHVPVTDKAVASTCTATGLTEGSHCEVCGKVLKERQIVAKLPHSYGTNTVRATMSANGSVTKKCASCGLVASKTTVYKISSVKLSTTGYTYNGKVKTPAVTVKDSKGSTLKKDTDYTAKYASGRKSVGTYKVTVTFKGKYSGSKVLTFKINPGGTAISKIAAKPKGFTAAWAKQATQTTGYQLQYSASSSFSSPKTVTVSKNTTVSKTVTGLQESKKYYVRVRTYKTVNDVKYYSAWSEAKTVTTQKAISIKLSAASATVYTGGTKTLKATTTPTGQTVKWKTGDKSVATVTDGKIKAVGKGRTTVTAYFKYKDKTYKATCTVTVKTPSVSLSKTSVTVTAGKSVTLKATTAPSGKTVTWKSSDTSVVKVSSSGKVTGVKKGKATVTASLRYGGKTYKKTCTVTVNAAPTAKTRIEKIKSYIKKNGIISNTATVDGVEYQAEISFAGDGRLMFTVYAVSGKTAWASVMFYDYGNKTVEIGSAAAYGNEVIAQITATLETEKYSRNYDYTARINTAEGYGDITDELFGMFFAQVDAGFDLWNTALERRLGFGMKEIGFKAYY